MLKLFFCDVYCLLDPRSTISYVTPFMAVYFDFGLEFISDPFSMSMSILVGDSVIAKRVYRVCMVSFSDRETLMDLIELDMVDFDIILGMG